ncbi:ATP-dependent RNA helicase ddx42 [Actinomortierella wolfii]|nr:ATP-dependent RNA helicase ddx42 [Actinomortierella wolfii]
MSDKLPPKRAFNISFGSGIGGGKALLKENAFTRSNASTTSGSSSNNNNVATTGAKRSRPALLGFGSDDDEDNNKNSSKDTSSSKETFHDQESKEAVSVGPPSSKLRKLDQDDNDEEDAFEAMTRGQKVDHEKSSSQSSSYLQSLSTKGKQDESDDEDIFSRMSSAAKKDNSSENDKQASKSTATNINNNDDEEDDPLDAFMACIDNQVKEEASKPPEEKIRRDDIEEEDYVESYMNHMKKKGIAIGSGVAPKHRDEDVDSDEEVYATARAVDQAIGGLYDSDDNGAHEPTGKKEITPLPPKDHSKENYPEIEKNFYVEHEDIAKLDDAQVAQIRKDLDMKVSGINVAKPCISFAHFGFDEALMETIRKAGYFEPSGIQKQGIPVALSGRDIIGLAKTGSGKTAAFLLPMIVHIMDQEELEKGDGPIGIVLAPTRELADQIYSEAKRFAKAYDLRVAVIYGGASKQEQFKTLRAGVEIVVATPGRLIDMVKMKATNFRRTSFLVLDEADRVLDLGFEPQVRSICDNIRPDRQMLLFSATFQKRVERLARGALQDPVRIAIGNVGQINTDVTQIIEVLRDDSYKWNWLLDRLDGFVTQGSLLIFVSRKAGVIELTENLKNMGIQCECLHGDMLQQERDKAVHRFKLRQFPTLIATDVAARGLDIKSIRTVVNYDVARDIDSHVHRVGRTGRAGEKGTAYTLVTEKDDRFAGDLVRNLEEFDQPVPPELMKVAMQNPRFRKSRQFMENRRGGRGGGRGGRGRGRGVGSGHRIVEDLQTHRMPYRWGSNSHDTVLVSEEIRIAVMRQVIEAAYTFLIK